MIEYTKKNTYDAQLTKLERILVNHVSFDNQTELTTLKGRKHPIDLDLNLGTAIATNSPKIKINWEFTAQAGEFDDEGAFKEFDIIAKFDLSFVFEIKNLKDYSDNQKGRIYDLDIMVAAASLAYSTLRGFVFAKCQGTVFDSMLLPIYSNQDIEQMLLMSGKLVE